MKVLLACEESQTVCKEFRALGHEAYSCDIQETSGDNPEWHIKEDVLKIINDKWDLIIAFPPCTHLAVSGAKHFEKKRQDGRQREAIEFFMAMLNAKCEKIAVENHVNIISGKYIAKHFPDLYEKYKLPIKPNQKIQPWQFGDPFEKKTCLGLKGLPLLKNTNEVEPEKRQILKSGKSLPTWYSNASIKNRSKIRSKTFPGIAKAMASQWS